MAVLWLFPPLTSMGHLRSSPPDTYGFRFSTRNGSVTNLLVVDERRILRNELVAGVLTLIGLLIVKQANTARARREALNAAPSQPAPR